MDRQTEGARLDLGCDVGDLVVAERLVEEDLVRGRAGQRIARDVMRVAVRVGAVPQHLDEREEQWALELLRVRRIEERRVEGEVAAAREQQRVVNYRNAAHAASDVMSDR